MSDDFVFFETNNRAPTAINTTAFGDILVSKTDGRCLLGTYQPAFWSPSEEARISRIVKGYFFKERPFAYVEEKARDANELLRLKYVITALESFKSIGSHRGRFSDVVDMAVSREGIKKLKRIRTKSFLVHCANTTLLDEPDWWKDIESLYIDDIGDIFNYVFAYFWEEEDEKDYLIAKTPLVTDPEIVKQFESTFNNMLSTCVDFDPIKKQEVLLRVSSTIALEQGKRVPHFLAKSHSLGFSRVRSPGDRVFFTTDPGKGRDAIINEVEDLNTIQLINDNVRSFLSKNYPEMINSRSAKRNLERYVRRCKKYPFFYCRDIKKEGLSKPVYLLKIMLDCLQKRYPNVEAFAYSDFYTGRWLEELEPVRGHALGMANDLTTLMQIIIYHQVNMRLGDEESHAVGERFLAHNDDQIVFISATEESVEDYVNTDFDVCIGLGILISKDKSFFSTQACVFCETYFMRGNPGINDKGSYKEREMRLLERASSILEAKLYLGSLKGDLRRLDEAIGRAYSKHGFEFSPLELTLGSGLGGPILSSSTFVDSSLSTINESNFAVAQRIYLASRERKLSGKIPQLRTKDFTAPVLIMYPEISRLSDEVLSLMGVHSKRECSHYFYRPKKDGRFGESLLNLSERRSSIFRNSSPNLTIPEFFSYYVKDSNKNVKLPSEFIERKIKVKLIKDPTFSDPYQITNPLLSAINSVYGMEFDDVPRSLFGLYQPRGALNDERVAAMRARALSSCETIDFYTCYDIDEIVLPENEEDYEVFFDSYINPFFTAELVEEGGYLPIPLPNYRNGMLELRKSVYGKILDEFEMEVKKVLCYKSFSKWLRGKTAVEALFRRSTNDEFWADCYRVVMERKFEEENNYSPVDLSLLDTAQLRADAERLLRDFEFIEEEVREDIIEEPDPSYESDSSIEDFADRRVFSGETYEEAIQKMKDFAESVDPVIPEEEHREVVVDTFPDSIFKKPNELPEGGIDIYGSAEWLRYIVRDPIAFQDCVTSDPEFEYHGREVYERVTQWVGSDFTREFDDSLVLQAKLAAEVSWIAHYYDEWVHEDDDREEEAYDFSDMF